MTGLYPKLLLYQPTRKIWFLCIITLKIETVVVFLPLPWHFMSPFNCLFEVLLPFSSQIWPGPLLIPPLFRTLMACSQFCATAVVAFCGISFPGLSTHPTCLGSYQGLLSMFHNFRTMLQFLFHICSCFPQDRGTCQ